MSISRQWEKIKIRLFLTDSTKKCELPTKKTVLDSTEFTAGCTHHRCKFCTLYADLPFRFRMSPMEEFEEDLAEIKSYQPYARHIFWTGANPFAMSYENLKLRALTVRDYLIKCQTMAMFASIRDIRDKEVWQLKKLRAMGINGLTIGTESGDRILFRLHDRACGEGQGVLECGEQCKVVQPAQSIFYFRGFPHAVPGYGTVPHGTEGEIYPCRG